MSDTPHILYLCNTHGQLLYALCDALLDDVQMTLLYLEDEIALGPEIRERLQHHLPELTLHVSSDAALMHEFANLPRALPAILRRNLRAFGRARGWQPAGLRGQRYTHGIVHSTGFFAAKVVAGLSDHMTLREGGLNNYAAMPVHGPKQLIRAAMGYTPRQQTIGEERWIDTIAVSRPADLPAHLHPKSQLYNLHQRLARLNPAQKGILLSCLGFDLPDLPASGQNALLLTQPLEMINLCDRARKEALYTALTQQLRGAGYRVFLKNHPRETPFEIPGTTALNPVTPIELWSLSERQPFDLAVALCSAALSHETTGLCKKPVQLVRPEHFQPAHMPDWQGDLGRRLDAALAR